MEQTKEQISLEMDEISKNIDLQEKNLSIVEEHGRKLSKELIDLRDALSNKKKEQLDNDGIISKANHLIRELKRKQKVLERAYWRK